MENLSAGELTIEIADGDPATPIQCIWKGKSADRDPQSYLAPYFRELLVVAAERQVPLEMHFEKLDHFNSSTIAALIRLILSARGRSVKLVFVYDQNLKWQKLSFDALRVFEKADGSFALRPA